MYRRAIYWFKRDLRIDDNIAFKRACEKSKDLIPLFIFIPELLNKFKGYDSRLGFLVEAVKNLSHEIQKKGGILYCFHESPFQVFDRLIKKYKPDAVFTNKAFSWTGQNLESQIEKLCKENNIPFHSIVDNFLVQIEKIPYKKIYSSFYKHWRVNISIHSVSSPEKINTPILSEPDVYKTIDNLPYEFNKTWDLSFGFKRIFNFNFHDYENTRNRLDLDGTSKLSPYIRFGLISLRKLYAKASEQAGQDCQFLKELAWREFWYHIKINFPQFNELEFLEKRRNINWQYDEKLYKSFIDGKTGYPIVDASISQLKKEGWMHNRARMIVANFFTKDLLMDWRLGEKFFMEYLLDYDEVVNVGNWQWNASVGPDPKPLRIFNPILQAKKFDPEAKFIKKYLPELKNIPAEQLHDPLSFKLRYYSPIVNHYERVILIRKAYSLNRGSQ